MEPLRVYDYLVLARARVLAAVRGLSAEEYGREFPMGPGSIARTLTHIMISEWYYVARMRGREVPEYARWPIRSEEPPAFSEVERVWEEQARETRAAVAELAAAPGRTAGSRAWEEALEYRVTTDDGRRVVVTATAAGLFVQLVLHEVHHRAQVLNMLRQMGAGVEGDLDFNAMMFERREAGG
ncbi:MAG: DinB family protein [Phycisphaerales bacterium]